MERSLHFLMMISAYKDVTFSATLDINPYHQQMTEQNAEFGQGILTPWVLKIYTKSAVVWRKVLLVLFMIFELGPYLESLRNGLTSEPIRCGVKEFFHPNN